MTAVATLYAHPDIIRTDCADGSVLPASATPLGPHPTSVVEMLRAGPARARPGRGAVPSTPPPRVS